MLCITQAFMTEDLTPLRQYMFFKLRNDDNIEAFWSINGRLKCLKKTHKKGDRSDIIDSPYDLAKVGYSKDDIATIIQQSLFNKTIKS